MGTDGITADVVCVVVQGEEACFDSVCERQNTSNEEVQAALFISLSFLNMYFAAAIFLAFLF
jgi:hypothetical protein